jgi:hypothetical protein
MALIEINVSGRIPKYFFGVLNEKYRNEIKESLEYCNDDVETGNDFLNLIFALTLENPNDPKEALFNAISKENLEKLPHFNELANNFIENGGSHHEMIDWLFDSPDLIKYGSYYGISFFEDDAQISILDVENDQTLVEETSLKDFISGGQETIWAEDVKEGTEQHKDVQRINEFKSVNSDFGFDPDDDYYCWNKNEAGATFLSSQLMYAELDAFTQAQPREEQVTIYFDDITTWSFYIDTEDEQFDMKNLTFVSYPGAEEFRNSACKLIFSHLFYKNEVIQPDENWIRDKGITLMYGESRGLDRLDFFING